MQIDEISEEKFASEFTSAAHPTLEELGVAGIRSVAFNRSLNLYQLYAARY